MYFNLFCDSFFFLYFGFKKFFLFPISHFGKCWFLYIIWCFREYSACSQHLPVRALSPLSLTVRRTQWPPNFCVFLSCVFIFKPHKAFSLRQQFIYTQTYLPQLLLFSFTSEFPFGVNFLLPEECVILFSLGLLGTACLFQPVRKCLLHLEKFLRWLAEIEF